MKVGELRKRVTLLARTITQGSGGAETITHTAFATVWAAWEPQSGRRDFAHAQSINAQAEGLLRIRYRTGITPDMLVEIDGETYQILGVPKNLDSRNVELWLICGRIVR